ncbi:pentatricopeptide repeat-containing protein At4g37170-like [Diospyros lotus]|uniref:pentatricopeptide repeat-containing protein At4g37170-like n=1 Tax=Diospyros lotus TaxID=55363 RepID=UPI00225A41C9|nr:pentatricopeptide repeat-containing protein At4g37170-like [Diospyros lotus]
MRIEGVRADEYTHAAIMNEFASRSQCGLVGSALLLLEEMHDPDIVSWTTVISGFSNNWCVKEAFWSFKKMQLANIKPNSFTLEVVISACADSSAFQKGKQFHGHVIVGSAIVHMYSKCGEMEDALRVFENMPERDIASWNGIICGFAQNGEATKALKLYDELLLSEPSVIAPNDVTFIGVLNTYSHGGLVREDIITSLTRLIDT